MDVDEYASRNFKLSKKLICGNAYAAKLEENLKEIAWCTLFAKKGEIDCEYNIGRNRWFLFPNGLLRRGLYALNQYRLYELRKQAQTISEVFE